jgi:hypothetical protein
MEQVIDAVIEQLNQMRVLDRSDGGFADAVELSDAVWWGDPKILPEQAYPFMFVEPVTTVKTSENTGYITRHETVRVGLLVDPRDFFNQASAQDTETPETREMVQTMDAIERWFEKTTLRLPNGITLGSKGLEVGTTSYDTQLRGDYFSSTAMLMLEIDVRYPRQR